MKASGQENRLSRWSRRKQQTADENRKEDLVLEIELPGQGENEIEAALSEDGQQNEVLDPVLSDADMEPVETLTENSDFSKFMSPGVSDELRNLALRKMFQAPFFNIRDGLDEYDEDYTTFEKLGDIVTADMRHQIDMEAKRKLEAEQQEDSEAGAIPDKQDLESDLEQKPSVAEEDEGLQQESFDPVIDELVQQEIIPHSTETSDQSADKIKQN